VRALCQSHHLARDGPGPRPCRLGIRHARRGRAVVRGDAAGSSRWPGRACRGRGHAMKYLIVNGDDFGYGRGINRGIVEAHERGILTSTSLMVKTPWSEEAAALSRSMPDLSVG